MERSKNFMKKKITLIGALFFLVFLVLMGRLVYLMVFQSQYYSQKAEDIEERERDIKAARGRRLTPTAKFSPQTRRCVRFRSYTVRLPTRTRSRICWSKSWG